MEKYPQIEYVTPKEALENDEPPQHRFDLILDGKKIGSAEIDYFSKPLPLYQLTDLYVDFEHHGNKYSSQIMGQVEEFLKERKRPGVLVDAILPGSPAYGMYERRGWKKVPGMEGLLVFNWPSKVSLDSLKGYAFRYTDLAERKNWKPK